jgi:RNA polymerase sigma-70 factor (ECF subfamily)
MSASPQSAIASWFEQHRSFLWGLSYRITGSAADADDVVQDTFVRACQHAPKHLEDPRRWLTRVAVNLGRDVLRRRKRRAYIGPWLPTPISTDQDDSLPSFEPIVDGQSFEGRYDLLESASLAFLHALEVLTPMQRAVLLLRDVFDYSAAEAAAAIDATEGNVRIIHHRARRAIDAYERRRTASTPASRARTNDVLRQFVSLLTAGDVTAIERMLAADAKAVTDGGGEFTASPIPIVGPFRVARFFSRLAASRTGSVQVDIRSINGQAAAVFDFPHARGRRAPRLVLSVDLDQVGSIANVWVIASATKLALIR